MAIDIWSLAVVIFEYGYGLPYPGQGEGLLWCQDIAREANSYDSDDVIDLLTTAMLVCASQRESAETCLNRVLKFSMPSRDGGVTPTPASPLKEVHGYPGQEIRDQIMPISSNRVSIVRISLWKM